jgi:cellulose synthase/poly-beta-1,6-N-acetylglucosamine synthase-like glycosyltransferase
MIPGLLWIIGTYGLCVILVHIAYGLRRRRRSVVRHYVLVSRNHQLQIEWYIRSLRLVSWIKGQEVNITVIDDGSTDETLEIVRKLQRRWGDAIAIVKSGHSMDETLRRIPRHWDEETEEELIVIKLYTETDLSKLPLLL